MKSKMTRLICLLVLVFFSTLQVAYAEDWLSHYYEHPTPERFVTEVRALSKAGNLSNPKSTALISVFLGRIMAANPSKVEGWLSQLEDLKGVDRQTLLDAASFSGTKAAQAYLQQQVEAERYSVKPLDVRTLEPKTPTILDMLWADFFATGEPVPVGRIVQALNYAKYSGALDRFAKSEKTEKDRNDALLDMVFKTAMWSLESNARQHQRVAEILEKIYFSGGLTQPEKIWLSALLAKVMPDKYELSQSEPGQWTFKRKAAAVQGGAGWHNGDGKPVVETNFMKFRDDFGGSVLATMDEDWEKKWNTPPETKPNFNQAGAVPYGKKVYILTFFANPKLDQQGKANVRCDIKIFAPTGSVSLEQKDTACFVGAIHGSPYAIRLSTSVIVFSADLEDPPGTWAIEVMLRDAVRKVDIPLRTTFELRKP